MVDIFYIISDIKEYNGNYIRIDRIKSVDLNTLTPIEAMNLLYELKNMIW